MSTETERIGNLLANTTLYYGDKGGWAASFPAAGVYLGLRTAMRRCAQFL